MSGNFGNIIGNFGNLFGNFGIYMHPPVPGCGRGRSNLD